VSRIERLLNLTAALLNAERLLSAEQLRERVPGYPEEKASFRRQFERDKDALRDLGLPLTMEPLEHDNAGAQFGYRIIPDDYYLRDPGLAPDELSALHLAARVVHVDGLGGSDARWKLGRPAAVPASTGPQFLTNATASNSEHSQAERTLAERSSAELSSLAEFSDNEAFVPASESLAAIFAAIAAGRVIEFGYRNEPRVVEPGQLSFRNGHWYLAGFDHDRNDNRSFRVDRIDTEVRVGPVVTDRKTTVEGRSSVTSFRRPWELGDGDAIVAQVRIDGAQATWAIANLGDTSISHRHSDGSVTFQLHVRNRPAFLSFVLGFLDRAEIEEPPELQRELTDLLRSLMVVVVADPEPNVGLAHTLSNRTVSNRALSNQPHVDGENS
jgi:proteasome accessory factor B